MGVSKMAKRKKGIIITSTCALLAGAAVIAELALGGVQAVTGLAGSRDGRIFRKKFLILHIVKKVMILLLKCRNMKENHT